MKKLAFLITVFAVINGCDNSTNSSEKGDTDGIDSTELTSPTDSINPPGGVINSSAISTDTAAIDVQNTLKKKDSIEKKNKESSH